MRSIVEIIKHGGVQLTPTEFILPDPLLVGRNPAKLRKLADMSGVEKWTTELDEAIADDTNAVYFDAQTTVPRVESVSRAIEAGKHIYCEKPTAVSTAGAPSVYIDWPVMPASNTGLCKDKLWLLRVNQATTADSEGFFRQNPLRQRRIRLLGIRR